MPFSFPLTSAVRNFLAIRFLLKERRALDRRLVKLGHSAETRLRRAGKHVCSICGKTGHNARTCPMKGKKAEALHAPAELGDG
jgi:hypothetical protein